MKLKNVLCLQILYSKIVVANVLNNADAKSCLGNGVGIKEVPKGCYRAGDRKPAMLGWLHFFIHFTY